MAEVAAWFNGVYLRFFRSIAVSHRCTATPPLDHEPGMVISTVDSATHLRADRRCNPVALVDVEWFGLLVHVLARRAAQVTQLNAALQSENVEDRPDAVRPLAACEPSSCARACRSPVASVARTLYVTCPWVPRSCGDGQARAV